MLSQGLLYSAGTIINRVVPERVFRFRVFRVFQLQCPSDGEPADRGDKIPLTFRWCESDDDFRLARELTFFQSVDESAIQRLSACLAMDGPEPAGGVWIAAERFDEEELGVRVLLAADQAWIFAAYVCKSHRRHGVYRRLLVSVLCRESPWTHYASINPTNRASMAAHASFVRSTVGTCVSIRVGKITIAWAGGNLKIDRHLTLSSRARPLEIRIADASKNRPS